MRLQYIFHGQDKESHPFHVKSNWMPPVQQSIALESYLESVKAQHVISESISPKLICLRKLATKPARVFLKTNGTKTGETHLEKGGQPKKGN